jgi:hypothetical protein
MSGISRRVFGVMAATVLGCLVSGSFVRGDAPTTAPTGIITGIVTSNGAPVSGVTVRLMEPTTGGKHSKTPAATTNDTPANGPTDPAPTKKPRAKALQETTTSTDGSYTFSNVAAGEYTVSATLKGTGAAKEKTTVTAGATDTCNLTLVAKTPKTPKPSN